MKKRKTDIFPCFFKRINITVIVFFIVLLLGSVIFGYGCRDTRSAKESLNWPEAPGVVTASFVHEYTEIDDSEPAYTPRVGYSYKADGKSYSNDLISFEINSMRSRSDKTRSWAETIISDYPIGNPVTVYYNPANPQISVLQKGAATDWKIFLGSLFIITGAIGILYFIIKGDA
ncbi:MAG TPA: DUF3592 domain-containing protein [Spirochaetota bacterium]|nr:DUF3592 domain-containing protein [Spirochaetota bacterium]